MVAAATNNDRLRDEAATIDERFAQLVEDGKLDEAVTYAAERLGKRLAVWWGALCVWYRLRGDDPIESTPHFAAVDATVAWVLDPSEENRLAAKAAGDLAKASSAAGALASAPFWSEGSVAPPGQPKVAPPPGMAAKFVANAVLMAAATPVGKERQARLRQSLRMAAELMAGGAAAPHHLHEAN